MGQVFRDCGFRIAEFFGLNSVIYTHETLNRKQTVNPKS